jgi:hypothetical protein
MRKEFEIIGVRGVLKALQDSGVKTSVRTGCLLVQRSIQYLSGNFSFVKKHTNPANSCGFFYCGDGGCRGGQVKIETDRYKVTRK